MAKNANFVSHKKSKLKENGGPKLPLAADLVEGEIAINFAENVETLSIKNESGDVVTFSSDNYYSEKKLGSAFTGANSAVTVTDVLENLDLGNEVEVNSGYTPTGKTIEIWVDESVDPEEADVYTKAETDTLLLGKLDASAYTPTEELWVSGTGLNSVVLKGSSGTASGNYSVAEGYTTVASGVYSHAEGKSTSATTYYSHAEGQSTLASGYHSHAEGQETKAIAGKAHVEGYGTTASGDSSHAEGWGSKAGGMYSHAEGSGTFASGMASHAEGAGTEAIGVYSHTEGQGTLANGRYSHVEGHSTIANNDSEHASGRYNVSSSASTTFGNSGNTLFSVGNGTSTDARHNAFEIMQNGDIYIVNKEGLDVRLQDEIGNIDIDQVIDSGTSASTNAVSTSAVYKAVTDNELVWTNAFVALSGTVSAHTVNTEIHVTAADKTAWNAKVDASAIADFFDDAKYEDSGTTKVINFYHGNTIKATIDASDFIVDGMVDDVRIENGNLVIDFNTASGKQDISIPLTDIFDPSNYYNKTAIDNLVGSGFTSSSITDVIIENEQIVSAALTDLDNKKLDASDFIVDQVIDSGTSASTNAVATKAVYNIIGELEADIAPVIGTILNHTGNTSIHVSMEDRTNWNAKLDENDVISAITSSNSGSTAPIATKVVAENELTVSNALTDLDNRKLDATAYTPTDLSNYYTKSETSGATEISNALGGKVNSATFTGHTADTTVHVTSGEKSTWNNKQDVLEFNQTPSSSNKVATMADIPSSLPANGGNADTVDGYHYNNLPYLEKTTNEWNKEIGFGQTGKLLVGKFPCYDSNVTIHINSTTSIPYHCTAIMATQNINYASGGSISWKTYGDSDNSVTPNLYAKYESGSNVIEIYFEPSSWSKNLIHIQTQSLAGNATNVCEYVESIPSAATLQPTNTLSNYYTKSEIDNMIGNIETLLAAI